MVAGTRRGLLRLGTYSFAVQSLHVVFAALFVEYYTNDFLIVEDMPKANAVSPTDIDGGRLHFSKLGLGMLVAAQLMYAVCSVLHRSGAVAFSSLVAPLWRPQRVAWNEHSLAFVFGASWLALRLPFVPSAVSFTLAMAAVGALSERCSAFAQNVMRGVAAQQPKEEESVQLVSRAASGGASVVVLIATLLYDGCSPRKGPLRRFHWCLFILCGVCVCVFSVLRRWRCSFHGEEATSTAREDCCVGSRSVSGLGDGTLTDFHDFVPQTWQRRSMKALLVVRALHRYAHTVMVSFFHLLLCLGSAPLLSAAARAVILALVAAAPSFLAPTYVASAGLVGKKCLISLVLLGVCAVGLASLVAAFFSRGAVGVVVVAPVAVEDSAGVRSVAAVWLCALLLMLLRLLLDSLHDLLDLAQEDVVEEDAILFGRAIQMAAWTKRLCSIVAVPMESLSRITTLLLLAFTTAVEGGALAPSTITSSGDSNRAQSTLVPQKAAAAGTLWWTAKANMASTVLAVLSLQTCGVALAMLVVWHRYYNLEGKHLQFIQMAIRKRKDEQSVAVV
ncbi:hypothetical protein LSCM1_04304 [Leishmania martiniquensis]|uniref:Transmembrane protein n=1 Tax=Leishmania martiniquensis TaxID=1580590 RepID=A0A836KI50_9TRYP|nr:hypothetical protein LSCM1_04304 [Leishmania martiniquensis]